MGRFGGSSYLDKNEKEKLARRDALPTIHSAVFEEGKGYDGEDRFCLIVSVEDDPDRRLLTFGVGVPSRDAGIRSLIDDDAFPCQVRMSMKGRAYMLQDA